MIGFISNTLPFLQAISLFIGIAVGIMTFVYYYKKMKSEALVATAKIAAESVKATAAVVAEALKEKTK